MLNESSTQKDLTAVVEKFQGQVKERERVGGGRVILTLVYIHRTENGLRRSPKTCRENKMQQLTWLQNWHGWLKQIHTIFFCESAGVKIVPILLDDPWRELFFSCNGCTFPPDTQADGVDLFLRWFHVLSSHTAHRVISNEIFGRDQFPFTSGWTIWNITWRGNSCIPRQVVTLWVNFLNL